MMKRILIIMSILLLLISSVGCTRQTIIEDKERGDMEQSINMVLNEVLRIYNGEKPTELEGNSAITKNLEQVYSRYADLGDKEFNVSKHIARITQHITDVEDPLDGDYYVEEIGDSFEYSLKYVGEEYNTKEIYYDSEYDYCVKVNDLTFIEDYAVVVVDGYEVLIHQSEVPVTYKLVQDEYKGLKELSREVKEVAGMTETKIVLSGDKLKSRMDVIIVDNGEKVIDCLILTDKVGF